MFDASALPCAVVSARVLRNSGFDTSRPTLPSPASMPFRSALVCASAVAMLACNGPFSSLATAALSPCASVVSLLAFCVRLGSCSSLPALLWVLFSLAASICRLRAASAVRFSMSRSLMNRPREPLPDSIWSTTVSSLRTVSPALSIVDWNAFWSSIPGVSMERSTAPSASGSPTALRLSMSISESPSGPSARMVAVESLRSSYRKLRSMLIVTCTGAALCSGADEMVTTLTAPTTTPSRLTEAPAFSPAASLKYAVATSLLARDHTAHDPRPRAASATTATPIRSAMAGLGCASPVCCSPAIRPSTPRCTLPILRAQPPCNSF